MGRFPCSEKNRSVVKKELVGFNFPGEEKPLLGSIRSDRSPLYFTVLFQSSIPSFPARSAPPCFRFTRLPPPPAFSTSSHVGAAAPNAPSSRNHCLAPSTPQHPGARRWGPPRPHGLRPIGGGALPPPPRRRPTEPPPPPHEPTAAYDLSHLWGDELNPPPWNQVRYHQLLRDLFDCLQ